MTMRFLLIYRPQWKAEWSSVPRGTPPVGEHHPTSANHFNQWERRGIPDVEWLGSELGVIPVPWAGHPVRFTFSYALVSGGEVALIDPGFDTDEGFVALEAGLAAGGLSTSDIDYVVITHFHVDHWGMADRVLEASGARLALGEFEHKWYRDLPSSIHEDDVVHRFYRHWGVPPESLGKIVSTYDYHEPAERRQPDIALRAGEDFTVGDRPFRIIHTPGHSPGHVVLADCHGERLFSGDHILPQITSNVSLNPFGGENPMRQFEESLSLFDSPLWQNWEVFPGHEYRFRGLPARVRDIVSSIGVRSDEIRGVIDSSGAQSVWDIAKQLGWYRPWDTFAPIALRMALGETAAQLVYLGYDVPRDVDGA